MTTGTQHVWHDFAGPLRRFIRRRVADDARAEDLLAEVFLRIHRGLDTLQDPQRIAPWLYRIARNVVADHHRRGVGTEPLPSADSIGDDVMPDHDETRALSRCVRPMVERLPEPYREAVLLAELEGLPQVELAERLGLSRSGAKSRVQRGRALLKAMILRCCDVDLDRRGNVVAYEQRSRSCDTCEDPGPD